MTWPTWRRAWSCPRTAPGGGPSTRWAPGSARRSCPTAWAPASRSNGTYVRARPVVVVATTTSECLRCHNDDNCVSVAAERLFQPPGAAGRGHLRVDDQRPVARPGQPVAYWPKVVRAAYGHPGAA